VTSEPLLSNGCLLRLHHSCFQPSCHDMLMTRLARYLMAQNTMILSAVDDVSTT
jgi:hypothetical protein